MNNIKFIRIQYNFRVIYRNYLILSRDEIFHVHFTAERKRVVISDPVIPLHEAGL